MGEQGGVYSIDFLNISYTVENKQKPAIIISQRLVNRENYYSYTLTFQVYSLFNVESLKDNLGAVVTFNNGSTLTINEPFEFTPGELDSTKTNTYSIELNSLRPTKQYSYGTN